MTATAPAWQAPRRPSTVRPSSARPAAARTDAAAAVDIDRLSLLRALRPVRRVEIVTTRAQRRARPRPLYAVIAVAGVLAIVIAQLLLSIAVSDGAYRIAGLQNDKASLAREQQSLEEQDAVLASPQCLSDAAAALGMVEGGGSAFLNAKSGAVTGRAKPAKAASGTASANLVPNALDGVCSTGAGTPTNADARSSSKSSTSGGSAEGASSTSASGATMSTASGAGDASTSSTSTATSTTDAPASGAPASTSGSSDVASQGIPAPQTH